MVFITNCSVRMFSLGQSALSYIRAVNLLIALIAIKVFHIIHSPNERAGALRRLFQYKF